MFRTALLGIASALLLPISLQAQTESTSSPSPLEVTVKPTGQHRQLVSVFTNQSISVPELSFDIRNVSQKCVVGISLRTEDKDSDGKVMATGGATFFRQHDGSIVPALNRCAICKELESAEHKGHDDQRDETLPRWHGWYSLRRFVARSA